MPSLVKMDELYIDIAERVAQMSHGRRLKVGCLIVKDTNIISYGWNGMPSGMDNNCEDELDDGTLVTKREVLHAESNSLAKLVASGGNGAQGGTIYTTQSPCFECAKLIWQAKIKRVVFRNVYRDLGGVQFLHGCGVIVEQLPKVVHSKTATIVESVVVAASSNQKPPEKVVPPPKSPKPFSMSMLAAVAGGNNEIARLRAAEALKPPTILPDITSRDEVIIGNTNFVPIVAEDEVAALLRAHEEATNGKTNSTATSSADIPLDGPYTSNFL